MKKLVSLTLVLLLALSVLTAPAMAAGKDDVGYLSYLNMSEEEFTVLREAYRPAYEYLEEHGVLESVGQRPSMQNTIFYDSLDAMLMGLMAGEVSAIDVPDCTAHYLCAVNDQIKQIIFFHPEKAEGFSQRLLGRISNGYSFMMLEKNSDLRDQFDQAIAEMKADGTLENLVRVHITEAAESGEPAAVAFEQFDGDPIRVAVTGALPPMDYVAEDGSFAGFSTAILAEIGKRLEKNIELVQVDSVGRALALAQGNVDVVFWTRAASEGSIENGTESLNEEGREAFIQEKRAHQTEEENAIMQNLRGSLTREVYRFRDMPEGTVNTSPYYSDINVAVTLK